MLFSIAVVLGAELALAVLTGFSYLSFFSFSSRALWTELLSIGTVILVSTTGGSFVVTNICRAGATSVLILGFFFGGGGGGGIGGAGTSAYNFYSSKAQDYCFS